MTNIEHAHQGQDRVSDQHIDAEQSLLSALRERRPLVLFLGQDAWGSHTGPDPVLIIALERLGRPQDAVRGWPALLSAKPLLDNYFEWLAERFSRRPQAIWLETLARLPWSAIFTSSIDSEIHSALRSRSREPQLILTANEIPVASRSTSRTPIYYLYGRAGVDDAQATPPRNSSQLRQRTVLQAIPMLNRLPATATPLGLVVVDGYSPDRDWLDVSFMLAVIEQEPATQVIWCGVTNALLESNEEFKSLVDSGRLLIFQSRLTTLIAGLESQGKLADIAETIPSEAGTITFGEGKSFSPAPEIRIRVEATAAIVDDSWLAFQAPIGIDARYSAFRRFHGDLEGPRSLVDGVRSGFAITRDFESRLSQQVNSAIDDHSHFSEALLLHGQSGTGKSIALARLAAKAREAGKAAVLYSTARIPQAADIERFCESAEDAGAAATLVICDCNASVGRYQDLLASLRSRGRRVVLVGTSYRHIDQGGRLPRRFVEAPDALSGYERDQIIILVRQFADVPSTTRIGHDKNVLATLYRLLPASRHRLSIGLSREARSVEEILRARGSEPRPRKIGSKLAEQLIVAGLATENEEVLTASIQDELAGSSAIAGRLVDFVMSAGRLNCPIPINLLMRAITEETAQVDISTIAHLFQGLDLFRWRRFENEGEEILIAPRLVLEAELICRRRLINATEEGAQLIKLIKAVRLSWDAGGAERRFLLDLLHCMGPDGPLGTRYWQSYLDAGRALSGLRENYGVNDPSLMLQEAVLRHNAIRQSAVLPQDQLGILEEAREAVQAGLDILSGQTGRGARYARSNLSAERAVIYGFLATYRARQSASSQEIWSAYQAARAAARSAIAINDSYYPFDVSLWVPADLFESHTITEQQKLELLADINSMLDRIDPSSLPVDQRERFNSRRLVLGDKLNIPELSNAAFSALEAQGSTAGYYLKARAFGPHFESGDNSNEASEGDRLKADQAAAFLRSHWQKINSDERCLRYLLECEWIVAVGQRLLKGERAALPAEDRDRQNLLKLVKSLRVADANLNYGVAYIEAVLSWLVSDEQYAGQLWREIARETDYVDPRRVIRRNILTDEHKRVLHFSGRVESESDAGRLTVRVNGLNRRVQLLSRDFSDIELAYGRTVPLFAIAFNYIGPIADPVRK